MARRSIARAIDIVLRDHGRMTFSGQVGFDPSGNTPAPLFKLLLLSLLLSARIRSDIATAACRALLDQGWTTPRKMSSSSWRERADILNAAGYSRYDESTSRMLGETTTILLEQYRGDLRRLRDRARQDPSTEQRLLTEFKGIGPTGAGIFLREVQSAWIEAYPFADERVLDASRRLGLPPDPHELATYVPREDFPRLVAGILRADRSAQRERIRDVAAG